jgi:hypothetical protein
VILKNLKLEFAIILLRLNVKEDHYYKLAEFGVEISRIKWRILIIHWQSRGGSKGGMRIRVVEVVRGFEFGL